MQTKLDFFRKPVVLAVLAVAVGGAGIFALSGGSAGLPAQTTKDASSQAEADKGNTVLATVNGNPIVERDVAPLVASGLDKANALDRLINREVAATLGKQSYAKDVDIARRSAERDLAANIYATKKMQELLKEVSDKEVEQRYNTLVKDADFNGYKLTFALFPSDAEAKAAVAAYKAGKAETVALFKPVVTGANGDALFVSRNDVPYNLGVFVAKLKQGEFTEPALVRNGYIVLYAQEIKNNPKPSLESAKESLRAAIADERLAKLLADARKSASVNLK